VAIKAMTVPAPMRIEVRPWVDFGPRESDAYVALRATIDFGVPPYEWTDAAERPIRLLGWQDERLVAHAGILVREVRVGATTVPVVGLCTVMVHPDRQGTGLGAAIVRASLAEGARRWPTADHAVFVCLESRVGFYERLGARRIGGPVTFDQPDGVTTMAIVTMQVALRDGVSWPAGAAHMVGLPW
jgi:predicted N-acetyltransferase YhbS